MICKHDWNCIDSRKRNGYKRRRYECSRCGVRKSSIEIDLPIGLDVRGWHGQQIAAMVGELNNRLTAEVKYRGIPRLLRSAIADAENVL